MRRACEAPRRSAGSRAPEASFRKGGLTPKKYKHGKRPCRPVARRAINLAPPIVPTVSKPSGRRSIFCFPVIDIRGKARDDNKCTIRAPQSFGPPVTFFDVFSRPELLVDGPFFPAASEKARPPPHRSERDRNRSDPTPRTIQAIRIAMLSKARLKKAAMLLAAPGKI
jgi:hypothetical protein